MLLELGDGKKDGKQSKKRKTKNFICETAMKDDGGGGEKGTLPKNIKTPPTPPRIESSSYRLTFFLVVEWYGMLI